MAGMSGTPITVSLVVAVAAGLPAMPAPTYADGLLAEVAVTLSGTDSAECGASAAPCRTVSHAVGRVASGGTVRIGPGWYDENIIVPDGLAVSLIGAGMDVTVLNGRQRATVVDSWDGGALEVADLSIVNGVGEGALDGGGITSAAPLTVRQVRLWHNAGEVGGGIAAYATTKVSGSIISGNSARSGGGGIFSRFHGLTLERSTVGGNRAAVAGGGIYAIFSATRITDSTITGNMAGTSASGVLVAHGDVRLRHTTVAGNQGPAALVTSGDPKHAHDITASLFTGNAGGDCVLMHSPAIDLANHNVSADGSCGRQVAAVDIDLRPVAELATGTTPIHLLGVASTIRGSIPAGDPLCDGTDQHGQNRRSSLAGGCDPGAYQSAPVPFNAIPPQLGGLDSPIDPYGSVGSATPGVWPFQRNLVYAFQWQRCHHSEPVCVSIPDAVGRTYRVTEADAGSRLRVRVVATSATGISQPAYSAITEPIGYG
ncbi:hypothetical protein SAMN05216284_10390 [Micromonospora sediminimaris]|uniref:Right handed beta helix domain-containing protein n=2 Tax=Micromonospora sediminimaris TaxID=547162 RepID=A0A9W5UM51_9ACTN|nr:hypothetical protein Vse01_00870 [Micromonospora sediminimaris]SFC17640.1 hypothetical protein SAMN05216284_10390 [Micromonospora sediminimaris]